jgi:D-lyxose ketol-isomerase
MMTQAQATALALEILAKSHTVLSAEKLKTFGAWDWYLNDYEHIGVAGVEYVNTPRYCGREMVLLPEQIVPEHLSPPIDAGNPGKEKTFLLRYGDLYAYVPGEPTPHPYGHVPAARKAFFTVWHEIVLHAGDQHTFPANTRYWCQAGPDGAVITEFTSFAVNARDIYTDPEIQAHHAGK